MAGVRADGDLCGDRRVERSQYDGWTGRLGCRNIGDHRGGARYFGYMSSHFEFASFLNIMFIPGAEELVVYAAALSVPRSVSYGTTRIRPKYLWEIRVA